jgi:hypothetical protein
MPLSTDAVRDWVGDHEIGKGRPYAESAAVSGAIRSGSVLRASVKGTRNRPYRVRVTLGENAVEFGECSCPVGYYGKCKHVAAVLLAYLDEPARFADLPDADANLEGRSKPELVALVKHLLRRAPELEAQLAFAVPGFVGARTVDVATYYWQAMDVIRGVNLGNDWAEHEIAEGLGLILASAGDFADKGEIEASNAVVAGVADALIAALVPEQRDKVVASLPAKYRPAVELLIAGNGANGAVENLPF